MTAYFTYAQVAVALGVSKSELNNAIRRKPVLQNRGDGFARPLSEDDARSLATHFFIRRLESEHESYVIRVVEALRRDTP